MSRLRCFAALCLVAVVLTGCAKKKKEEPPPPPPPPAPAALPPPPPKVYPDPTEFVPPEMTMAIGLRPQGLESSKFGESLLKQFEPVAQLTAPFGWKLTDMESVLVASNPAAEECLLCMRTLQPFDIASIKEKLRLPVESATADQPAAYAWRDHPQHSNAVAIYDEKTVLLGRRSAVERAIKHPTGGPVRAGYDALADKTSPYWVAGDAATAAAQASRVSIKDFEKTVRDLVGLTGFASSSKVDGQLHLTMVFVFQSEAEAGRLNQWMDKLTSTVTKQEQEKEKESVTEIPDFGGEIIVGDQYRKTTIGPMLRCEFECVTAVLSIGADFVRATGGDMLGDGLFAGVLGTLHKAVAGWRKSDSAKGAFFAEGEHSYSKENISTSYSWMVQLLPFLGHQDIYDRFDFKKGWIREPKNFMLGYNQIGEFLNPANPTRRWEGFPYPSIALSHFVGMAGVEPDPSDVAAEYEPDNPNVGVFGYNRIAKDSEITDGLAETIMLIGNERLPGPWLQGGGSTIRGARAEPFDDFSGFHSEGLEKPGVYVLMADGSAHVLSKDIDPKVFRAMCTIHGAEKVDLQKIPTTRPKGASK